MNSAIYMKELGEHLRKLPAEDYDAAMEYFKEAGAENEAQAIADLGTPKHAAEQIIMEMALKNSVDAPKKSARKSFSALWVGILAVFAAPIAVPLAFAVVITIVMLAFAVWMVLLAGLVAGAGGVIGGGVIVLASLTKLFSSTINACATIGVGLIGVGLGLALCPLFWMLAKKWMQFTICLLGNVVKRIGERKNAG